MFLGILRTVLKAHLQEHYLRVSPSLLKSHNDRRRRSYFCDSTSLPLHIFSFLFLLLSWIKIIIRFGFDQRSLRNIHLSQGILFWSENLWWTFPDRIWWGIPENLLCLPLVFLYQDTARREVAAELLRSQNTGSEQALLGFASHGGRPPSSPFHHSTLRSMTITERGFVP